MVLELEDSIYVSITFLNDPDELKNWCYAQGPIQRGYADLSVHTDGTELVGHLSFQMAGDSIVGTWIAGDTSKVFAKQSGPSILTKTKNRRIHVPGQDKWIDTKVEYPFIDDPTWLPLNDSIAERVFDFDVQWFVPEDHYPSDSQSGHWQEHGGYTVDYLDEELVGISSGHSDEEGSDGHMHFTLTNFTFSKQYRRPLKISDVFDTGQWTELKSIVAHMIDSCVTADVESIRFSDSEQVQEFRRWKPTDDETFEITHFGVSFGPSNFLLHDLAGNECAEVTIPFSKLRRFLLRDGPFGKFILRYR
jgi:hypothetical protein